MVLHIGNNYQDVYKREVKDHIARVMTGVPIPPFRTRQYAADMGKKPRIVVYRSIAVSSTRRRALEVAKMARSLGYLARVYREGKEGYWVYVAQRKK